MIHESAVEDFDELGSTTEAESSPLRSVKVIVRGTKQTGQLFADCFKPSFLPFGDFFFFSFVSIRFISSS